MGLGPSPELCCIVKAGVSAKHHCSDGNAANQQAQAGGQLHRLQADTNCPLAHSTSMLNI